jgi:hypothetical protein
MVKWDYDVIKDASFEAFRIRLNAFGSDGWEAISANYVIYELAEGTNIPAWIAVMKRENRDHISTVIVPDSSLETTSSLDDLYQFVPRHPLRP